jgi:hypothetical protein
VRPACCPAAKWAITGLEGDLPQAFPGPRLCAVVVGRLTFDGDIIERGTDSRRLAQPRAQQQVSSRRLATQRGHDAPGAVGHVLQ